MSVIERIKAKARMGVRRIVLPEGDEPRTVEAAVRAKAEGLACPILLGDAARIAAVARERGVSIEGIETVDPALSPEAARYAAALFELRRAKGVTE